LIDVLSDPSRAEAMAARGRQRCQHFSWDRVSQQVLSYYERLIYERRLAERGGTGEP